jgi:AraC-like DNA-binding protein
MSIPGVGVQTSAAFAAAVDEAGRFKRSRTAGAYFGLVPRRHQSGELDWTGRITKQGDGTVRKLLYEAANSILTRTRQTFALKTWALKIAKRRGLKKARVALARRLAVIMHAMLRDGTLQIYDLVEARRRLADGHGVTETAFAIGYTSASQFSREYKRAFRRAPVRDLFIPNR